MLQLLVMLSTIKKSIKWSSIVTGWRISNRPLCACLKPWLCVYVTEHVCVREKMVRSETEHSVYSVSTNSACLWDSGHFIFGSLCVLFVTYHSGFYVFPFIFAHVAKLSTHVVTCFLHQPMPGLSPAHWSGTIWNLCLFALGTLPFIQSHCGEVKPSSSVLNNEWGSNVLTPVLTHHPSCLSVPACINRLV